MQCLLLAGMGAIAEIRLNQKSSHFHHEIGNYAKWLCKVNRRYTVFVCEQSDESVGRQTHYHVIYLPPPPLSLFCDNRCAAISIHSLRVLFSAFVSHHSIRIIRFNSPRVLS